MKRVVIDVLRFLFPPRMEKKAIWAVHEDGLASLIDEFGLSDKLEGGELLCYSCDSTLSKENLECITSSKGEVKLFCHKPGCYHSALESMQNGEDNE